MIGFVIVCLFSLCARVYLFCCEAGRRGGGGGGRGGGGGGMFEVVGSMIQVEMLVVR